MSLSKDTALVVKVDIVRVRFLLPQQGDMTVVVLFGKP